jgi:iron complex transport system permease protein
VSSTANCNNNFFYKQKPGMRKRSIQLVLIVLFCCSLLLAAGIGAMPISPLQVTAILCSKAGIHLPVTYTESMANVLLQIRLPRVCLAILVGAGLAVAGAALQGLFRNPMADPALVGISSGASVCAVGVIVLSAGFSFTTKYHFLEYYFIHIATFTGALVTSQLVLRLSRTAGQTSMATLLLAGLAVNALCNAFTSMATFSSNNEQLRSISFWLLGSLGGASWQNVLVIMPFVLVPVVLLPLLAKSLNAFALGEAEALYLGVQVKQLKTKVILLAALAVGACVAVSGMIGFVGLIVPHMLRTAGGSDHRYLLPACALGGASLLTAADVLSRTLLAPAELPIGILTALLGAPVFLALLLKQKKQLVNLIT